MTPALASQVGAICHSFASMNSTLQSKRAWEQRARFRASGEKTCINCHKGSPHLPDGAGVPG